MSEIRFSEKLILDEININPSSFEPLCLLKRAHYRAALNWLTKEYKMSPDAYSLDKVRCLLELFHHLCEVEDWERASKVLMGRFNISNDEELGLQLGIWGYPCLQVELYRKLYNKDNARVNAFCLFGIANGYRLLDDYPKAQNFYKQASDLFVQLEEKERGAWILHEMGIIEADRGRDEAACTYYKEALALFRKIQIYKGIALVLNDMARVEANQGNYTEAIKLYKESLYTYIPRVDDKTAHAWVLHNFGRALAHEGEYTESRNHLRKGLKLFYQLDNRNGIGWSLYSLSDLMLNVRRYKSTSVYAKEGLILFRELNNKTGIAFTLQILGRLTFKQAEYTLSRNYYQEKISIWRELGNLAGIAQALEGFARLAAVQEKYPPLLAPRLFGAAESMREIAQMPIPLPDYEDYEFSITTARCRIDLDTFETFWSIGRKMSIDEAVDEVLESSI